MEKDRMGVLSDAVTAAGGHERWNRLNGFTAHMSMSGALIAEKYIEGSLKDIVVEGSTRDQRVRIAGIDGRDDRAIFRPDWVGLEDAQGRLISKRDWPGRHFAQQCHAPWDLLHLAYYCGFAAWNYMTAPFLFQMPNVLVQELPTDSGSGRPWRKLLVEFPEAIATHCPRQTVHFDQRGLLRQFDFVAKEIGNLAVTQTVDAHQEFSGIIIPTLRRARVLEPDGSASGQPWLDVEIFDADYR
jgi:hypothetical protein